MRGRALKIVSAVLLLLLAAGGIAAGAASAVRRNRVEKLVIYNWADYMDLSVLEDFEDLYKEKTGKDIEVIYSTFDTNETMVTEITRGDSRIDLICPSEYAIQKLMTKGLLRPLDMDGSSYSNVNNVNRGITEKVEKTFPEQDGFSMTEYFVPYMWGTLGILYNREKIREEDLETGWGILWNEANNPELKGKILMKDSVRDVYVAAVVYLKQLGRLDGTEYADMSIEELINTVDGFLLKKCGEILSAQRKSGCLKGYEVDFGKDDMINGAAYADLAWSGDALWAIEESWDDSLNGGEGDYALDYFAPDGNVWFDGWAIPKTAGNVPAARMFIDFMCRPDIAARNMMEIGYTSAVDVSAFLAEDGYAEEARRILLENEYAYEAEDPAEDAVLADVDGVLCDFTDFFGDGRRYPAFGEGVDNLGVMKDFGSSNDAAVAMWERVKGGASFPWGLVAAICGIAGGCALFCGGICLVRRLKSRRRLVLADSPD